MVDLIVKSKILKTLQSSNFLISGLKEESKDG